MKTAFPLGVVLACALIDFTSGFCSIMPCSPHCPLSSSHTPSSAVSLQSSSLSASFFPSSSSSRARRSKGLSMMHTEMETISQLIAAVPVCPAWGEPGWAPFCFLNGNPVFNAFDSFQAFIQNDIVVRATLLRPSITPPHCIYPPTTVDNAKESRDKTFFSVYFFTGPIKSVIPSSVSLI